MFGSHALLPRNLHSPEPPFSVELSPCTSGYSGGQSLVTWEELGEVLGDVRGWQGRMVVEGSRSRTIILRITQWIYPTFGDSTGLTICSLHCVLITLLRLFSTLENALVPGQIQR